MQIKKIINSFGYAFTGLRKVFKEEQNFRLHVLSGTVVLFFSIFIFKFSYIELAILMLCIALVLIIEIINTVIEDSWDHLEPDHHPVVKSVKDMMAGAVMIASLFSATIWLLIIINHHY